MKLSKRQKAWLWLAGVFVVPPLAYILIYLVDYFMNFLDALY